MIYFRYIHMFRKFCLKHLGVLSLIFLRCECPKICSLQGSWCPGPHTTYFKGCRFQKANQDALPSISERQNYIYVEYAWVEICMCSSLQMKYNIPNATMEIYYRHRYKCLHFSWLLNKHIEHMLNTCMCISNATAWPIGDHLLKASLYLHFSWHD